MLKLFIQDFPNPYANFLDSTAVNANYTPAVTTTTVTESDFQSTQTLSPTRGNVPVPTILSMLTSPPVSNPTPMSMPTMPPFATPIEIPVYVPVAAPVAVRVAAPVDSPIETPVAAPVEDPVSLLSITDSPIAAPVFHDSAEYYYECQGGPKLLRSLQEQF